MKVPLLDLKAQYATIKKDVDAALIKCAESQYFILGPEVDKLEADCAKYLDCKYSLGISSGTDALLLALMAIELKPDDEVIIPTYSFFATAGVVARLNAKPVLCDNDPVTFNIDPAKIEALITPKTRAIIPVHLYGQSADMQPIMDIAAKHNLIVIEDGAQAIGTQYKDGRKLGSIGHIGCFSFFPSKNLGGFGDGGLVTTNDDALYERMKILRVHGGQPKYHHKFIGANFRIDEIQCAVLNVKLPHLDSWTKRRQENAELYTKLFIEKGLAEKEGKTSFDAKNKILLPEPVYKNTGHEHYHIYNQYIIRVEKRDELKKFLTENEIGNEIYYPIPFHLQECFQYLNHKKGDFPMAEFCANTSLAVPIYPELTTEMITFVVEKISEFLNK
jgi:dTDP-4-amino-4,6-dideoxygalactose transaminase